MQAGMVFLPGAALNAITAAIVGRLYDEFGPKQLVLGGTILMLFGTFPFVMIKATMPVWLITTAYAVRMIGNTGHVRSVQGSGIVRSYPCNGLE